MKYEYKTHAVYRGYGWIEPLTDSEDSLIADYLARRICEELNALQAECERLVGALETIQKVAMLDNIRTGTHAAAVLGRISAICEVTLAAHRKGGSDNE